MEYLCGVRLHEGGSAIVVDPVDFLFDPVDFLFETADFLFDPVDFLFELLDPVDFLFDRGKAIADLLQFVEHFLVQHIPHLLYVAAHGKP
jgi:hypothetical protein